MNNPRGSLSEQVNLYTLSEQTVCAPCGTQTVIARQGAALKTSMTGGINMEQYTVSMHIRLTEEQAADWKRKAEMIGFKESSMVRALVDGYEPKEKPDLNFFTAMNRIVEFTDEIRKLRNMIQSTDSVDAAELDKEIKRWQKLRRDLEVKYLAPDPGFMLWHKLPKDLQIKYSGQLRKTGINQ